MVVTKVRKEALLLRYSKDVPFFLTAASHPPFKVIKMFYTEKSQISKFS